MRRALEQATFDLVEQVGRCRSKMDRRWVLGRAGVGLRSDP